ncbi:MAG: hypothetical protein WC058_11630 [Phycisphaeraceae bacterium]
MMIHLFFDSPRGPQRATEEEKAEHQDSRKAQHSNAIATCSVVLLF